MPAPISEGPVRLAGIHHVSIAVTDLERALDFWTGIFGLAVQRRIELPALRARGAFVGADGLSIELWALAAARPVPDERRLPNTDLATAGTKHVAFRVADLAATLDRLAGRGVAIVAVQASPDEPMRPAADHFARPPAERRAFAAFIHDPFGTLIELLGPEAG